MRALLLASGGIDSPVAGHLMKLKGLDIIGLHLDRYPFSDNKPIDKTKRLMQKIGIKKLFVADIGSAHTEYLKRCDRRLTCVFCRRMMFRIAEAIAKKEKCNFIVTGENLAQVASQTLENIKATEQAISIPILRPLLGFDKVEIMDIAKRIGTFEISTEPGLCCTLVPKNPSTKATISKIDYEEKKLAITNLICEALGKIREF